MKTKIFFALILLTGTFSCTVTKDERLLKKSTKEWRKSPAVLEAYADAPFAGTFLTLRENGKFENSSSGIFKSFAAGSWVNSQDTISLSYLDSQQNITNKKKVFIDRKTSTLIFEGDSMPVPMRLRIMLNKL